MQIVLARLDEEQVIEKHGRIDLGERHKFKKVAVPISCMWLRNGDESDAIKAGAYAKKNGFSVFCYDRNEENPLDRARKDIMVAA